MGAITGTTAAVVGALSLLGGAEAARQVSERKTAKKQQRLSEEKLEAQKRATQQLLAAPGEAAERARQATLARRRRRAKTVLTSPRGVLEPATLERKTLLGE